MNSKAQQFSIMDFPPVRDCGKRSFLKIDGLNNLMKKIISQQIKARRLSEVIENHIKDLIMSGELRPGDRLPTEKALSEQFGVSLVTMREALKGLESIGLIEKKPGRRGGAFISEVNSDALKTALHGFFCSKKISYKDINELRVVLEPLSIKMAATRITAAEIERLEENIEYCLQIIDSVSDVPSKEQFAEIDKKNIEFHSIIAQATKNPLLVITIEWETNLLFFLKETIRKDDILAPDIDYCFEAIEGHRRIVEGLKKGDAKMAEKAMREHIKQLEHFLVSKGISIEQV